MLSLGSLFTQLFSREKKARAEAQRRGLVESLAGKGQRAFEAVAGRTGLVAGIGPEGPKLDGEIRGTYVSVELAENPEEGLMMRFSAKKETTGARSVTLGPKPRGLAALFRGAPPLGDPEIDELFAVRASSIEDAKAILDERAKETLLSLPDRMPIYFDYRSGDAVLDVSGVELDPERIVFLLEWLVVVAGETPDGKKPYRG